MLSWFRNILKVLIHVETVANMHWKVGLESLKKNVIDSAFLCYCMEMLPTSYL